MAHAAAAGVGFVSGSQNPLDGEIMADVWVIRSDHGKYTEHFVDGAYVGAGWLRDDNLSDVKIKDELTAMYHRTHPDHSPRKVGANVGMLWLFLKMAAGDYVITPCSDSQWLYYGRVIDFPYRYAPSDIDGCWFPHRRAVAWDRRRINRSEFSEKAQNTLKHVAKTAFRFKHNDEFFEIAAQKAVLDAGPPKYSTEEISDRGNKIYAEKIKVVVEPQDIGKFVAIDIESDDYEVDWKALVASRRLRERRPDSVRFLAKVGRGAAYRIGWRPVRPND